MKLDDLSGKIFSRLTVINRAQNKGKRTKWHCVCTCGNECDVPATNLKSGRTQSCGCWHKEVTSLAKTTHGLTRNGKFAPEYIAYYKMRDRCYKPSDKHYKDYGGRGITVCDRWLASVENFVDDMGKRPSSKHSIDRINNDGNYEPENCRWATQATQSRNQRSNRYITAFGETKLLVDWAKSLGVRLNVITKRLDRGWSSERAVSVKPA